MPPVTSRAGANNFDSVQMGAFDEFGETRTGQFWQAQHLLKTYGAVQSKQGWLVPPPGLEQLPAIPLNEPTRRERLEAESDLFGYTVSARFEAERQALALMDHQNIARVLDAGATATGRPYFVMELVQGIPITQFCDKNKLPVSLRPPLQRQSLSESPLHK